MPFGVDLLSDSGTGFEGVGPHDCSESVFSLDSDEDVIRSRPAAHLSGERSDPTCADSAAERVSDDVNWEGSGGERLTDASAFKDNVLEVSVELKSSGVTLEDLSSAGKERSAQLEGEGLAFIREPESSTVLLAKGLWPDGSEVLSSDLVSSSGGRGGEEEILVSN